MNIRVQKMILLLLAAALLAGCAATGPPDLTDLGNGTMRISSSPLQWQLARSPFLSSWEEASGYVADLELGGHNDWRLPTREELLDLYFVFDFGNASADGALENVEGYYWVAEKGGTGYIGAWKDGEICEISRVFSSGERGGYVRAVRP